MAGLPLRIHEPADRRRTSHPLSLLSIQSYLATYTLGEFRMSFWSWPTELRLLLIAGNPPSSTARPGVAQPLQDLRRRRRDRHRWYVRTLLFHVARTLRRATKSGFRDCADRHRIANEDHPAVWSAG
jgi:hypothetical protein